MRTTRRANIRIQSAEGTFLRRRRRLRLDEDLRDSPRDKSDDDEVDHRGQKISNTKLYRTNIPRRLLPVAPGTDRNYDRHDEVVYECLHQRVERRSNDDGDRQRDDVLLQQEVLEFLEHAHRSLREGLTRGREISTIAPTPVD